MASDEEQLAKQAEEIAAVNEAMRGNADSVCVLRSIELNLSPSGAGDMEQPALDGLDLVLGCVEQQDIAPSDPPFSSERNENIQERRIAVYSNSLVKRR